MPFLIVKRVRGGNEREDLGLNTEAIRTFKSNPHADDRVAVHLSNGAEYDVDLTFEAFAGVLRSAGEKTTYASRVAEAQARHGAQGVA